MGTGYSPAPEIKEIADALIKDHHGHLKEAVIEYLWREGAWSSKGRLILGSATLAAGLEKYYLDGAIFRILINADAWATLDPAQRRATVDHQLYHCEKDGDGERDGAPKWCMAPHDLEEFTAVVDRHGLYMNDVRQFVEVAMKKSENFQARLDLGAVEAAATVERRDQSAGLGPLLEPGDQSAGLAPLPTTVTGPQGGEPWTYAAPDHGTKPEEPTEEQPAVQ